MNLDPTVASVAAREHAAQKRPVRAHVIVTYDFNRARAQIMDIFGLAGRCDDNVLDFVHRQLVQNLLDDIKVLRTELDDIERWARAQSPKRSTPLRL